MKQVTTSGFEHGSAAEIADVSSRLKKIFGGQFDILHAVAIGGMAILFKMRHRLHHGYFIVKVLHRGLSKKPGMIRSFHAEAVHAASLGGHPNAVPVFDFGEADGLFFLTMPYVEGEDLDKLLERSGAFSREEALEFAAQLSSLLGFAETKSIVHCDLTPPNIRRDVFGVYRLLDFGISQSKSFQRDHSFRGGTPLYTTPEQLRGETPDFRSDLYSLGAILAEMMTGHALFHADSLEEIDRKHLSGDWQLPPALNEDTALASLLRKLLATDRDARFQSAYELSGALAGLGFPCAEFREHLLPRSARPDAVRGARRVRLAAP